MVSGRVVNQQKWQWHLAAAGVASGLTDSHCYCYFIMLLLTVFYRIIGIFL